MSEQMWICDNKWQCPKPNDGCGPIPESALLRNCLPKGKTKCCHTSWMVKAIPYPKEVPMYELLKPVSIKMLEEAGACERELHRFAFLLSKKGYVLDFGCDIGVQLVIEIASQCTGGIDWLLANGFIREKAVTYHIGQRFEHNCEEYILASIAMGTVNMIRLSDGARCVFGPAIVDNPDKITKSEINIFLEDAFTLIK